MGSGSDPQEIRDLLKQYNHKRLTPVYSTYVVLLFEKLLQILLYSQIL